MPSERTRARRRGLVRRSTSRANDSKPLPRRCRWHTLGVLSRAPRSDASMRPRSGLRRRRPESRPQSDRGGFPDPGRLPAIVAHHRAGTSPPREPMPKAVTSSRRPAPPSSACCGASQPPFPTRDPREALHLAEHSQDPHPRAVPQARRNVANGRGRAHTCSACSTRANHPGDPPPTPPKPGPNSGKL
jgi:hypothetical protein